jgi:hypothetical protein
MEEKITKLMEFISKTATIHPVIDFEKNIFSYPFLSHLGDDSCVTNLLEKLSSPQFDILEKGISERLLVCPDHPQYLATSLRLYCTQCASDDITKLHLMEHISCGYIFEKKEIEPKSITCSFCKHDIKDGEGVKKLGRWY